MHLYAARGPKRLKLILFAFCSFALLFLNFYTDFLHVAEPGWFYSFDRESERLILGRLIKSRQDGILSFAGFPVSGVTDAVAAKDPLSWRYDRFDNYDAYVKNTRVDHFAHPYYSQICGQGFVFGILDRILPCAPSVKLRLFHALTSALTATAITAAIAWFYLEFGLFTGAVALLFAIGSQWLTVFARSLWWSLWAFYLPMIVLMFSLLRGGKRGTTVHLGRLVFFSIFVKTIFNGFEYITTTLIMMATPFVYYSVLRGERPAAFLRGLMKMGIAAGLAMVLSAGALVIQIAAYSGDFREGIQHISDTLKRRTHLAPDTEVSSMTQETLNASTLPVVVSYLRGAFYGNGPVAPPEDPEQSPGGIRVSYAALTIMFAAMTLALYFFLQPGDRRIPALIAASWFSILAPLSWFIIFKSHCFAHTHLNFIVWQMPFTFFGAALAGRALQSAAKRSLVKYFPRTDLDMRNAN